MGQRAQPILDTVAVAAGRQAVFVKVVLRTVTPVEGKRKAEQEAGDDAQ